MAVVVRPMDNLGMGARHHHSGGHQIRARRGPRPVRHLFGVIALLAGIVLPTPAPAGAGLLGGSGLLATLDPLLVSALAAASPADELVVVARVADPDVVAPGLAAVGLDVVPYDRLAMVAARGTPAEITLARSVAGVASLWLNTPLLTALDDSVALIGADIVHDRPDLGFTGAGIGIAVLDSGIDGLHPDLTYPDKTVQNVKVLGNQHVFEDLTLSVEDLPNTDTTTGHGTHVAGIAAGTGAASDGRYAGVAPGAHLVGVGSADGVEMFTALAGYDWILANHAEYGIRVINNSWADGAITYDPAHPLNVASKAAHDAGITVVFAAGNDGQASGDVYNRYAFPDWVIGVGGVTKLGTLGDYSSRGTAEHHPDVMAPGSFIASARAVTGVVTDANSSPFDLTDPLAPEFIPLEYTVHYTAAIGTSMSAPHVAGVVALMLEANPALTPDQVKALLVQTASPVPGCPVWDCGAGTVDALAAVTAALGAVNDPPVAVLVADPATGPAPLTSALDASTSHDPDGSVVGYEWDLDGNGSFETEGGSTRSVTTSEVRTVAVRVIDDDGARSAPVSVELRTSEAPTAAAVVPRHARSGQVVTLDGSASSDPDGSLVSFRWDFGDGTELVTSQPSVEHVWSSPQPDRFAWSLVVTDDTGIRDAVSGTIRVTP